MCRLKSLSVPKNREPRFVAEFPDPRPRRAFLFRTYIVFAWTVGVWLVMVLWATNTHDYTLPIWEPATETRVDQETMANELFRVSGHPYVMIAAAIVVGISLVVVYLAPTVLAWFPINLVVWMLFALGTGYLLASTASTFSRAIVVHTLAITLVLVALFALYCAIPCHRWDFHHLVAAWWVLALAFVLVLVLILPHSDEYIHDWGWLYDRRPIAQVAGHAYSAAAVWTTLALVVILNLYFLGCSYSLCGQKEPEQWLASALLLSFSIGLLIAFSISLVYRASQIGAMVLIGTSSRGMSR
jgi:hypothetical protein